MVCWVSSEWNCQDLFRIESVKLDQDKNCIHSFFEIILDNYPEYQILRDGVREIEEKNWE